MSTLTKLENSKQLIFKIAPEFDALAKIHGAVNFRAEASFALQALETNSYLAEMAYKDPDSLRRAVINVAAIGLTLNPAYKLCYLVPRDNKVCLDISYLGYIKLAVESGSIKWAQAEIVCKNDKFTFFGMGQRPEHSFEPFGDRGEIVGAYCLAKTHDEEFITSMMTLSEVHSIRDRSAGWRAHKSKGKSTPWVTDESEMIKKTVIKRAYKSWPMTDTRKGRLEKAIDISNEVDPIDFDAPQTEAEESQIEGRIEYIRSLLSTLERTEEQFIEHLCRANRREIKSLSDLTEQEMIQATSMLEQFANKKAVAQ